MLLVLNIRLVLFFVVFLAKQRKGFTSKSLELYFYANFQHIRLCSFLISDSCLFLNFTNFSLDTAYKIYLYTESKECKGCWITAPFQKMLVTVESWHPNTYRSLPTSLDEFRGGRFVFSYNSIITDTIERNKVLLPIYDNNYNKIRGENIEQKAKRHSVNELWYFYGKKFLRKSNSERVWLFKEGRTHQ